MKIQKIELDLETTEFKIPNPFDNEDLTYKDKALLRFEMKHLAKT